MIFNNLEQSYHPFTVQSDPEFDTIAFRLNISQEVNYFETLTPAPA